MVYKNTTLLTKTLYGVEFKPGSTHNVPGYINIPGFVLIKNLPKEPPKVSKNKLVDTVKESTPKINKQEEEMNGTNHN